MDLSHAKQQFDRHDRQLSAYALGELVSIPAGTADINHRLRATMFAGFGVLNLILWAVAINALLR